MILKYRDEHPDWLFIRHEDLSQNPLAGFKNIFSYLELEFTDHNAKIINHHSLGKTNHEQFPSGNHFDAIQRDSVSNIYSWRNRLTAAEIDRIKSGVENISREFYSENEW